MISAFIRSASKVLLPRVDGRLGDVDTARGWDWIGLDWIRLAHPSPGQPQHGMPRKTNQVFTEAFQALSDIMDGYCPPEPFFSESVWLVPLGIGPRRIGAGFSASPSLFQSDDGERGEDDGVIEGHSHAPAGGRGASTKTKAAFGFTWISCLHIMTGLFRRSCSFCADRLLHGPQRPRIELRRLRRLGAVGHEWAMKRSR
jgi:hypothetical protein